MKGLTDLAGLHVGHATDREAGTGCTVILCGAEGAAAGVSVGGWAAGDREFESLRVGHVAERIHALVLAGGSAFGLDAASGVVRFLEEQGIGFDAGIARVPIVPAAILFDLQASGGRRPDAAMGRAAAERASDGPVEEGTVGAGTGATVGKLFGRAQATKGGLGTATVELAGGVHVSALAAVNAFGDVRDPATGAILAGVRRAPDSAEFVDTVAQMMKGTFPPSFGHLPAAGTNTTLVVVATDATFDRVALTQIAAMAQAGLARTLAPVHTQFDGDVVFALSLGAQRAEVSVVGTAAAEAVAQAVVRGVKMARSLGGIPACGDLGAGG